MLLRPTVLFAALLLATAAHAQTPPIKPGLWQLHTQRLSQGGQSIDMAAQMNKLPPEARKQMEAMMKERGVDMGGADGGMKVCLTRESLDQGNWRGTQPGCTTETKNRSSSQWSWRAVCTNPPSESEGEATFTSPEAYTVKNQTTVTRQGKQHTMQMSINGKWLGADCGGLKPITAETMQPKAPPR